MNEVSRHGFGGFLKFNLEGLEKRNLLCFLMDMIDTGELVICIGGGRIIPIKLTLCSGRDALMVSLVVGTAELAELK